MMYRLSFWDSPMPETGVVLCYIKEVSSVFNLKQLSAYMLQVSYRWYLTELYNIVCALKYTIKICNFSFFIGFERTNSLLGLNATSANITASCYIVFNKCML